MGKQAQVGESWGFCLILHPPMAILFREKLEQGRVPVNGLMWTVPPQARVFELLISRWWCYFGRFWNLLEVGPIWREGDTSLGAPRIKAYGLYFLLLKDMKCEKTQLYSATAMNSIMPSVPWRIIHSQTINHPKSFLSCLCQISGHNNENKTKQNKTSSQKL